MAKGQKRAAQPSEEPQWNQPEVPEEETRVDLGDEEMDPETMKNSMASMQAEMVVLKANQENVAETIILQQREIDRQRHEQAIQKEEMSRRQRGAATTQEAAL